MMTGVPGRRGGGVWRADLLQRLGAQRRALTLDRTARPTTGCCDGSGHLLAVGCGRLAEHDGRENTRPVQFLKACLYF